MMLDENQYRAIALEWSHLAGYARNEHVRAECCRQAATANRLAANDWRHMNILLRHLASSTEDGTRTEPVDLPGVPSRGDELHWPERIVHVRKVVWFPQNPNDNGPVACLLVEEF